MYTKAIGSQIVTLYLVQAIDGLACLYGGIFFDGRWELRRDYTNSYIEFAITSPQHTAPHGIMSSRFTIGSIATFICKSTCIFILISMMNLSLEWCGWIRPLEVSGTETRMCCDERRVSVAWHQSEQIRLTTPLSLTAIQKHMQWYIFTAFVKGCVDDAMTALCCITLVL